MSFVPHTISDAAPNQLNDKDKKAFQEKWVYHAARSSKLIKINGPETSENDKLIYYRKKLVVVQHTINLLQDEIWTLEKRRHDLKHDIKEMRRQAGEAIPHVALSRFGKTFNHQTDAATAEKFFKLDEFGDAKWKDFSQEAIRYDLEHTATRPLQGLNEWLQKKDNSYLQPVKAGDHLVVTNAYIGEGTNQLKYKDEHVVFGDEEAKSRGIKWEETPEWKDNKDRILRGETTHAAYGSGPEVLEPLKHHSRFFEIDLRSQAMLPWRHI